MGSLGATQRYPEVIDDLFAGRTVTLLGRYASPGRANVTLSGYQGGKEWSAVFDVTLPEYAIGSGYVPRIWALRRVGQLLADIKQGNSDPALVTEALVIAKRFGVATDFTHFVVDAQGNANMTYSPVPVADTGSVAVDTSAALSGYGKGTAVGAAPDSPVRYFADRSLPMQAGYLTDTKLAGDEKLVDLSFGSDLYFTFAQAEAAFGASGLLSTATNAKFELLGRSFRVTDPAWAAANTRELPSEAAAIPGPSWRPSEVATEVAVIHAGTAPTTIVADPAGTTMPIDVEAGGGCTVVAWTGLAPPAARGGILVFAALLFARRRRFS